MHSIVCMQLRRWTITFGPWRLLGIPAARCPSQQRSMCSMLKSGPLVQMRIWSACGRASWAPSSRSRPCSRRSRSAASACMRRRAVARYAPWSLYLTCEFAVGVCLSPDEGKTQCHLIFAKGKLARMSCSIHDDTSDRLQTFECTGTAAGG